MLSVIDKINEWAGRLTSFLIIPLIAFMVWGVTLRYVFDAPVIWADEMSLFIFGGYIMLGGGYTLLHDAHVNVPILHSHLHSRARATVDLITSILFYCVCAVLLWKGIDMAWSSLKQLEHSFSVWGPPVYPVKLTIPIGAFLLLLQGITKFTRDFMTMAGHNKERSQV